MTSVGPNTLSIAFECDRASRSVRCTWTPCASSRASASGAGCPYVLRAPTLMTAISGRVSSSQASEVAVREPWCPTFKTSTSPRAPRAGTPPARPRRPSREPARAVLDEEHDGLLIRIGRLSGPGAIRAEDREAHAIQFQPIAAARRPPMGSGLLVAAKNSDTGPRPTALPAPARHPRERRSARPAVRQRGRRERA